MPEINLQQPTTPDIYSFGFDRNLNKNRTEFSSNLVYNSVGELVEIPSIQYRQAAADLLFKGKLKIRETYLVDSLKSEFLAETPADDDLQSALSIHPIVEGVGITSAAFIRRGLSVLNIKGRLKGSLDATYDTVSSLRVSAPVEITPAARTTNVANLWIQGEPSFSGAGVSNYGLFVDNATTSLSGRVLMRKGVDVASAGTITLTTGNYFDITGTTTINFITTTNWGNNTVILQFDSSLTVTHNAAAPPANTAAILLSGSVNFAATANDTLQLVFDSTTWREVSRTVI